MLGEQLRSSEGGWRGWSYLILGAAVAAGVVGCGRLDSEIPCTGEAAATIARFVLTRPIYCVDAKSFEIDGKQVSLTHISFGAESDCPAGCETAHICAIEDPTLVEPQLFYGTWISGNDIAPAVRVECPDLPTRPSETWPDCVPSGLRHPLVATSVFRTWAVEEATVPIGPFISCVNRYALTNRWP